MFLFAVDGNFRAVVRKFYVVVDTKRRSELSGDEGVVEDIDEVQDLLRVYTVDGACAGCAFVQDLVVVQFLDELVQLAYLIGGHGCVLLLIVVVAFVVVLVAIVLVRFFPQVDRVQGQVDPHERKSKSDYVCCCGLSHAVIDREFVSKPERYHRSEHKHKLSYEVTGERFFVFGYLFIFLFFCHMHSLS
jgi:uncharacterized membrane protein